MMQCRTLNGPIGVFILATMLSIGGCVTINQDDPLNIILIEAWESRQHYENYFNWRVETGAIDALGALLSQAPNIRYYDNLATY